jgi:hypothetical protein
MISMLTNRMGGLEMPVAPERVRSFYGVDDVERAAERMEISVSDEEAQAIVANIDDEIDSIAAHASRHVVEVRIADWLRVVDRAHTASDDD